VNGLLLMSSYSYIYYNLNSHLIINNLNLDMSYYFGHYIHIHIYHNTIIYISLIHIINLCYLSSYSTLLNIGLNRLGNLCFDNSLFYLL
jgi:hypothetical protein